MKLNLSQEAFCNSDAKHIRLLAPAGSGKTQSLLWRCKMLQEKEPNKKLRFLLVAFTNAAKDEIRERLKSEEFKDLEVTLETLNKYGSNQLKGITTISKDFYQERIRRSLKSIWRDIPFLEPKMSKLKKKDAKSIFQIFDNLMTCGFTHKDNRREIEERLNWINENNLDAYFQEKVVDELKKLNLLDDAKTEFSYQVYEFFSFWKSAILLLYKSDEITLDGQKYWANFQYIEKYIDAEKLVPAPQRYHHIFVDEFQDINPLDLSFIKTLAKANDSTLTIIGDDDQAIYEWRGSVPKFILKPEQFFEEKFTTFLLDTNYRSPKNVVEISQKLISNNENREPKNVKAFSDEEADIKVLNYETHKDCLDDIIALAKKANETGRKLAIISRIRGQLIPTQIKLTKLGIDFYTKGDLNVFQSKYFQDLVEIIHLVPNKNQTCRDAVDKFIECCNYLNEYKLSDADKKKLKVFLNKKRPKTFMEAFTAFCSDYPELGKSSENWIQKITSFLDTKTVSDTIKFIGANFEGMQVHFPKDDEKDENIFYTDNSLFMYLEELAQEYGNDYAQFVNDIDDAIAKMPDDNDEDLDDYAYPVHLMTALRTKGREFDTVVILDAVDGLFPIKYAEDMQKQEQERRLFYVAVTRAKKELIFMVVDKIRDKAVEPSPFLAEMGIEIGAFV